jgi:hypothetical protein
MLQDTERIKRRVTVNLTDMQRQELKEISEGLGVSLSVLLSLLIRYFIYNVLRGILTLETLLRAYHQLERDRSNKKRCKATLSIYEQEFQDLNKLADHWFYLPGELSGILVELFTAGIIDPDSIWNVHQIGRATQQNMTAKS